MTPKRTAGDEFAELFGGQIVDIFVDGDQSEPGFTGRILGSRCTDRWIAMHHAASNTQNPPDTFVLVDRITHVEICD